MFDLAETDRLLSTTRAVRRRLDLDRPVARETILECLDLAIQAPTASNAQDWRWLVVTDAQLRADVAEVYRGVGAAYLARVRNKQPDAQTTRVYESAYYLTEILHRVPVFVIPCLSHRVDLSSNALASAAYGSIMPAAWSFMLALRARGLGSVWTTLHLVAERAVADILGIPAEVTQIGLFPVAYTVGSDFKPASRPPASTVTYFDGWN